MSIDMTGLARLGSVGLAKVLTDIPRGEAKEGIQFAFKVKKAAWIKGEKYGYMYHLDVVVRTLDMQTVLGTLLWKVYPSMLPEDIIEAIDCDTYDNTWWLVRTEVNEKSKASPPRTLLVLIDRQEGLDTSGPSKPAADMQESRCQSGPESSVPVAPLGSSERGQAGAGGEAELHSSSAASQPPAKRLPLCATEMPAGGVCSDTGVTTAKPCLHEGHLSLVKEPNTSGRAAGFYCDDCGGRVG